MKKFFTFTMAAILGMALVGCTDSDSTNEEVEFLTAKEASLRQRYGGCRNYIDRKHESHLSRITAIRFSKS